MKIVTVGNAVYLGTIAYDDNSVTVKAALSVSGDVTPTDLKNYLKHENAGTLEKDIVIRGNAAVFSERELSDDLQDSLTILQAQFKKAEKVALPRLVNAEFDRM